ncbi:MAG: helix-turn-helix transcriptional regulator [Pseudorhodoplanes sp.]
MGRVNSDAVFTIIDNIYAAAEDRNAWSDVVTALGALFNTSQCCFGFSSPDPDRTYAVSSNLDPAWMIRYREEFFDNILTDTLETVPVGLIYHGHSLVGPDRLRNSSVWNEWMAPQDMYGGLGRKLLTIGQDTWFIDMQRGRGQPTFDRADVELLQHFIPHLVRASQLSWTFQTRKMLTDTFARLSLGVLIVDDQMRIKEMNAAADAILSRPSAALVSKSGSLEAAIAANHRLLRDLVAASCMRPQHAQNPRGGYLLVTSPDRTRKAPNIAVTAISLPNPAGGIRFGPHATLLIREITLERPDSFADTIRVVYALTPKEAELAAMLTSGHSLKDAAAACGMRFSTARSHLERIFRKTGTRQQHQLVALLRIAATGFG